MIWDNSTSLAASSSGVRAISSRYMPTRSRSAISPPWARTLRAASVVSPLADLRRATARVAMRAPLRWRFSGWPFRHQALFGLGLSSGALHLMETTTGIRTEFPTRTPIFMILQYPVRPPRRRDVVGTYRGAGQAGSRG